jgi:DNA-directed RNA polymerase subunit F
MDSAEKQRGASAGGDARRKRKANAAGIQTTNQESPAPGSAERAAAKQSEQSTSASEHRKRFGAMMSELEDIMKQPNPHVAAVAQVAELVQAMLVFSLGAHPLPKEIEDEVVAFAERAREILGKAAKTEVSSDGLSHLTRLTHALQHSWWLAADETRGAHALTRIHEWVPEIPRRVADALARLALRDDAAKRAVCAEPGLVEGLRRTMDQLGDSKGRRAVANALIALDVHEQVLTNVAGSVEKILDEIRRIPEHAKAFEGTRRAEFRRAVDETLAALKRDARTLVDISKQDPDHVGTLVLAGAAETLVYVLGLPEKMSGVSRVFDEFKPVLGHAAGACAAEKEACHALTVMLSHAEDRATHQTAVADAGAIPALVRIMNRPPPPASSGLGSEARRAAEAYAAASHDLARRAADALAKLVQDRDEYKTKVRDEDGVSTLRTLLDRRDPKVQRAAAAALLVMGEHERLVKEIERNTETLVARPDADRARDALKAAVRTLAELAKEGATANAEGDMVDAVVRSGAVEAIVPLLSLSQRVGEEFDVSFGDIEKEASYAISLMASRDVNQNRIAKAGALPGLVALLQRYPPQTTGSVPTSVARRAADAVTNLAHENNNIKNQVRVEGGIPPLVSLLETKDPKVKRAAASALRTLAFKNDDNKNQIVECGALPMLIFMVKSEDQLIHYEAVGVIGNLVHSSTHIKRRVLDEGALQPVIGLLSSACPESQREAALLLGQFATTDSFKVKMVQRGAVRPLIQMLGNSDEQLREMAAFALGRLAQDADNQVGILHAAGLRPLLDLLDCDKGNLQHNAAFALYGLADNEDNVPDIVREGTVQRLMGRELIVQASKDCVKKTLDRLKGKVASSARVLRYLIYLMTTDPDAPDAARIAVALAHLVDDAHGEELREVFIKKLGLPILLRALMPGTPAKQPRPEAYEQRLAEACHALHVLLQKVALKVPPEEAPLPPTPEAYLEQHFNNPEVSDITFLTHSEEFHAHKIAFARCPPEFHDDVVDFSHLPPETFRALMRFTYVSELDAERTDVVSDLMRVAVMYNMHELKRRCEVALAEHVKSRGAELDPAEVVERFNLAESLDAASVSRACALHAMEHHAAMIAALGVPGFMAVTGKMVPRIDEHARAAFHRLPSNAEARNRLNPN